jgi:hypothetical protein
VAIIGEAAPALNAARVHLYDGYMSPEAAAIPSKSPPPQDSMAQPEVPFSSDDARMGYQVASNLMIFEGNIIWARTAAFLVAHSIIIAISALNASNKPPEQVLTYGLPAAGLLFCAVWYFVTRRGFDYFRYWILSARELEERHLAPAVRVLSRGAAFASGQAVSFEVSGQQLTHQMWRPTQRLRVMGSSYLIIAIFVALYVLFLAGAIF